MLCLCGFHILSHNLSWFFSHFFVFTCFSFIYPKTFKWSMYFPVSLAAIDCEVGAWGPWSSCTSPCGVGSKERSRQVSVPPRNGGTPCPDLKQRRGCYGNNAICSTAKGENITFSTCPCVHAYAYICMHTLMLWSVFNINLVFQYSLGYLFLTISL